MKTLSSHLFTEEFDSPTDSLRTPCVSVSSPSAPRTAIVSCLRRNISPVKTRFNPEWPRELTFNPEWPGDFGGQSGVAR
eukprot:1191778-Prorocentrum_minimum.AAC.1